MVTRTWKVYGQNGHRQRESFNNSYKYDFTDDIDGIRIIEVENADKTGTNDYSIVRITRNTWKECEREFDGQITDGIFENSRVGRIEEVENMETLANAIYNQSLDMDYVDHEETQEKDLENLLKDLELLEKQGNGSLLNAIKMLVEN